VSVAEVRIRPAVAGDAPACAELAVAVRAPMWAVRQRLVGDELFSASYAGAAARKREEVERLVASNPATTLVAEAGGRLVAFLSWGLWRHDRVGEIQELAVGAEFQGRGIGRLLCERALAIFRERGCSAAAVRTGGDEGHAPARALYESLGFGAPLPSVRYHLALAGEGGQ
jgi:ribosomal protein S18 acetylase RimI-like enzyme